MTALVGIMNKRAAVMAADSAVTVTKDGKSKIYNTETKIFQVSNHPVGVMIYGSLEFMDTPWELILKLFYKKWGDKEHKTIKEYAEDLISFLDDNDYFCDKDSQESYLVDEFMNYFYRTMNLARYYASQDGIDEEQVPAPEYIRKAMEYLMHDYEEFGVNPAWKHYGFDKFLSDTKDALKGLSDFLEDRGVSADMEYEWVRGLYEYCRSNALEVTTGLVFVGYGSKDIFPSLVELQVAGAYEGKLRSWFGSVEQIDRNNTATICPFAQKDVIHSLLKGLRPDLHDYIVDMMADKASSIKNDILNTLVEQGVSRDVIDKVAALDVNDVRQKFVGQLAQKIQDSSISGVVDAVESFNVADMAKMAESLISVTNLHRHFSSSEESVGGPVNVAVITKTEGFVWLSHKPSVI